VDTGSVKSSIIEPRGPGEDLVDVWVRLGVLTPGQAEFLRGAVGNHISQQSKERNERIGAEAVRRMMITEEQLGSILAETETGDASTIEELLVQRSLITGAQCAAILESVEPPPVTAKAPAKFNAPKRRAADATDAAEWYHCRICARKGMLVALEPLSAKCPSCGGRRTTGELAGQCRFCLKRGKHVELLVEKVRCSVCRNQREVFSDGMTVESFQAGVG
jgi:rubrerythrin